MIRDLFLDLRDESFSESGGFLQNWLLKKEDAYVPLHTRTR
jgi:hypothetical protein